MKVYVLPGADPALATGRGPNIFGSTLMKFNLLILHDSNINL